MELKRLENHLTDTLANVKQVKAVLEADKNRDANVSRWKMKNG